MTEVEIKISLNREDYIKVLQHFAIDIKGVIEQTNIFFELAKGSLGRALRLRCMKTAEMTPKWVFTSKGAGKISGGVSVHSEIEDTINNEKAIAALRNYKSLGHYLPKVVHDLFEDIESKEFKIYGDFRSIRRVIPFSSGLFIEADESIYPDGNVFYELEIEIGPKNDARKAREEINQVLDELGVKYEDSKISKMGRLRNADPRKSAAILSLEKDPDNFMGL